MGGVCGVAVESEAVRISYFRDGQRVEDSIDAEGARWLLNGKLVDCGPFDDVVLTGRDTDVVESLLASLSNRDNSTIRMVDEGAALLAYARSVDELADARALLVLDLGKNGTSAFTLDVLAGEVKRSARRSVLSGDALDDIVERLVLGKDILPPAQSPEAEAEYRLFFRELKELVTESAGVRSPGGGPMLLTRAEFDEEITAPLLQTLAWAAPNEPDAVLLIGGGAKIPLVKTLVEQEWTVPLVIPESPGSVILEGAALEAAPSRPHFDIGDVMDEQALGAGTF
jgi:molecular chaperone DnaK (HSP70)